MIKRSFVSLAKPRIEYKPLELTAPEPRKVKPAKTVTLFLENPYEKQDKITRLVKDIDENYVGEVGVHNRDEGQLELAGHELGARKNQPTADPDLDIKLKMLAK